MKYLNQITLVCFISACLFSCKKETTQTKTSSFEKYISQLQEKGITTGNILVYKDGNVIYKNSNGLQSINPKDSLTLDSQFRLASVSKQFTGMAVMKLKEAGKLDYDQKVNTIIADFPYNTITIRHLLNHVSGLADYERLIDEHWKPEDPNKKYILGNDEIIKEFHRVSPELDFQPGDKWEYSNTGYLYLASIVEKVSGQHFRDFAKETIFEPLNMNNTSVYKYQIEADPNMPNRVFGYEVALNQIDLKSNDYNIVNDVRGDGGMYSTLDDLYKWNQALVNYTIIPKSYLDEAWTPAKLNNGDLTEYGFGWFISSKEGEPKVVQHSGGWVGFVTYLYNEVDANNGFIILTNNSGDTFREVYSGITSIMEDDSYTLPKTMLVKEVTSKILNGDLDTGIAHYHKFKTDTINYMVNEGQINMLGYQLINEEHIDAALGIFKLNIEEHPTSANPYDSYGDALLMKGDSLKALENFKKCFAMDSTLQFSKDKILKLESALKIN